MACNLCGHTMKGLGASRTIFWCARCGAIKEVSCDQMEYFEAPRWAKMAVAARTANADYDDEAMTEFWDEIDSVLAAINSSKKRKKITLSAEDWLTIMDSVNGTPDGLEVTLTTAPKLLRRPQGDGTAYRLREPGETVFHYDKEAFFDADVIKDLLIREWPNVVFHIPREGN